MRLIRSHDGRYGRVMKTLMTPLALALLCVVPLTTACRELRFDRDDDSSTPNEPDPDPDPDPEPDPVPAPRFAEVAVATDRSCAIDEDGGVLCWGLDLLDAEWGAAVLAPRLVPGVEGALGVALGETYACALIDGAGIQCWGLTPLAGFEPGALPEQPFFLTGSSDVTDFALSPSRICGVLTSGGLRCWGIMTDPGDCFESAMSVVDAFDVPGVSDATSVVVSGSATCFTRVDGSSSCYSGLVGETVELPIDDATTLYAVQSDGCFSAQARFCAVTSDGAVDCVEGTSMADLGGVTRMHEGQPAALAIPWLGAPDDYCIEVAGGALWCNAAGGDVIEAQQVAISQTHACALSSEATISCWGSNEWGALGLNIPARFSDARVVESLFDATTVAAGYDHSCATSASGELRCWGSNTQGQRGWLSTEEPSIYHPRWAWFPEELSPQPNEVPSLSATNAVFADGWRSCASEIDGSVVCWGLGLTFTMSLAEPTAIPNVSGATSIASGDDSQSCAVTSGGEVECWGRGYYGVRVGVETLSLPAPATQVDGDTYSACALLVNGEVYCWGGFIEGSLGNAGDPLMPQKMAGIEDAVDLSESCVVTAGHDLVCWSFPWLPGIVEQLVPTTVASGVTSVDGPCVLREGGQAACFADFGELDPAVDALVDIVGAEDAVEIASGSSHACALLGGGEVACWGWAAAGRLGDGSRTVFGEPMLIVSALE